MNSNLDMQRPYKNHLLSLPVIVRVLSYLQNKSDYSALKEELGVQQNGAIVQTHQAGVCFGRVVGCVGWVADSAGSVRPDKRTASAHGLHD